ncbi:MAG: ABC transporter permease, partial [Oscillospiraceae bacterium]|nr:ABC transporter permease [Oscillospiraceae bacterium]
MNEHKPFVHIVKRTDIKWWKAWIIRLVSVIAALIVCAAVIYAIVKLNPLKVYASMWSGAFGTKRRSWVTVRDTMMLLCIGVGLAPAFKMRFWNIGAEGQILIGGVATAACMIFLGNLMPTWLLLIVMLASSIIAGAVWGIIPALFKARWNTNETLFTLMMNYVAIQLTSFFVSLWEHPAGSNSVGIINQSGKEGWFPALLGNQYT